MPTNDDHPWWPDGEDQMPVELREFTVAYIMGIMSPHADTVPLPKPPASFADDYRAWFLVHWLVTKWTAHLIAKQSDAEGHAGEWAMTMMQTDEDGNEIADTNPDDAPPHLALASRLITCALNNDLPTAIALSNARQDVATEAFYEVAHLLHNMAAHGHDTTDGLDWHG